VTDDSLNLFGGADDPAPTASRAGAERSPLPADAPLAERMRPQRLDEILGQDALVGPAGFVRRLERSGRIPSLILHGPPGSGKTTLGRLLAAVVDAAFVPFNAVAEGVPRLREIVRAAEERRRTGRRTLLFVDEIHRLNRGQQDFLLPSVESGLVTLVGATTEHPGFEVNAALLSRTRVLLLDPLSDDDLRRLVRRALDDAERGLGSMGLTLDADAEAALVAAASGDARQALNTLEIAAELVGDSGTIAAGTIEAAVQRHLLAYDTTTAFQLLSAFHKSLRASQGDAALYWAMRMIRGGEDPLVLFRRLVAAAYEDVGLADPDAGRVAVTAMQAFERLGAPEGFLPLANAILYVAAAPKSNRAYRALGEARAAADAFPDLPVPLHLRNASTALMREWGFGEGYLYAHDEESGYAEMECLPVGIEGQRFYRPGPHGFEADVVRRMRERGQLE